MDEQSRSKFDQIRRLAMELTALSESALMYTKNVYDIERFHRVGEIAHTLTHDVLMEKPEVLYSEEMASIAGYTTPKLDVRGAVFNEAGNVLLVQEIMDGDLWTLPGGWCDIIETPSSAVEREVFEEAGVKVKATHLVGVLDREVWPHVPSFDRHMYKMLFICDALGPVDLSYTSVETSGIGWFPVDDLPPLSIVRVLPEQIELMHSHWRKRGPAYFD